MHYYQFNIGDYLKSTLHLSPMEDLAYRRLLDRYYDTENPLETDLVKLCRFIRMSDYQTETQAILDEYFKLTQKGWIQKRVQKELTAYSLKADTARANGKKGGRPKKTQSVPSGNPVETQSKAKQETLNNKHKPSNKGFTPPSQIEVEEYFRERGSPLPIQQAESFINFYSSKGWMVGKNKMKDWKASVRGWMSRDANQSNKQPQMTLEQLARQVDF